VTRDAADLLRRQLRDFGVAALLAIVVISTAFVAVRNRELASGQIELASRAVTAIASTPSAAAPIETVPPGVHAVVVGPATASTARPYLRRREVVDERGGSSTGRRELGGASAGADDKLFYDLASRIERDGGVAELLPDGSGRAIAGKIVEIMHDGSGRAVVVERSPAGAIAIAVTAEARPAPYPFLVVIGVLGLGLALAAAGGLVGGRAARLGSFAGISTLAVPALLWHAWVAAAVIAVVALAVALAQRAQLTDRLFTGIRRHKTALGFLAPAALAMLVLVATPFLIGIILGFYDHHHGTWTFVGFDNFIEILSGGGHPLDDPMNFWFILGVTVLWTAANVMLHVTIGVLLALALSRKWLVGRGVFRMLLILPWAIPNYITALIWKGMFDGEYGAINSLLHLFGLDDVSWFGSWATAFAANVATNTWLGFPFMMVVALGALGSIPRDLYEAASVDGASAWQRFRHITLPHLRPALGPAVALGSIWTFNMFNVIFLVSAGKPGGSTNILVTDAYRWAFERGERYGMAAAYATIIFLVLLLWTVFGTRIVRSKDADA
jgi:ABC-type sugar transport system permease subunit